MRGTARKFVQHVLPGVVRPLHILWHQVIGFLFLVLAIMPVPSAVRSFHDPNGFPHLILSTLFIGLMATFGIASFLRARKINRSPAANPQPSSRR
jgi:hypothetical protein